MAGKRVDGAGRAKAGDDAEKSQWAGEKKKAPRPSRCREFARAQLARELPGLVDKLLEAAANGSLPHLKALVQLSGLDRQKPVARGRAQGKSLETVLKEQWARDRAERERDRAEEEAARKGEHRRGREDE